MKELLRSFTMATILLLCLVSVTAQAPQGNAERQVASRGRRTIPLSADQVQNGRVVYDANCASCHGPSLSDGLAPSLTSRAFKARWTGQSAAELRDYIRQQMPPGQAGTLTNEQNTNLVALLLNENGYTPGEVTLPTDDETVARMPMQFPEVRFSSGGPLAWGVKLPPWPTTPDPTQRVTPVTDDMLRNPAPGDWLTWRRTQDGLGFSPLTQITAAKVFRFAAGMVAYAGPRAQRVDAASA